jgi:hypothetical protein
MKRLIKKTKDGSYEKKCFGVSIWSPHRTRTTSSNTLLKAPSFSHDHLTDFHNFSEGFPVPTDSTFPFPALQ